MSSSIGLDFRARDGNEVFQPRALSIVVRVGLAAAGLLAAVAVPLHLVGLSNDAQLLFIALSHVLGLGAGAIAFYRGITNLRRLTGTPVMSHWNTALIGFAPLMTLGVVLFLAADVLLPISPFLMTTLQVLAMTAYVGWVASAIAWPFIWIRLLSVGNKLGRRSNSSIKLLVWTGFASSSASFVAKYLVYVGVDGLTAQVLSSVLAVLSLLVLKQMAQALDDLQSETTTPIRRATRLGHRRVLINLPPSALWAVLLLSISIYTATLVLDANRVFRWF